MVAYTVAGGGVADGYRGGLSTAREQISNVGLLLEAGNNWNGTAKIEWRYRKQRKICTVSGNDGLVRAYDSGDRRFVPWNARGGSKTIADEYKWTCNKDDYATRMYSTQMKLQNGRTLRLNKYFEIAGVRSTPPRPTPWTPR